MLLWLARTAFYAFASAFLLWIGIRVLDVLTPRIHERQKIGESPISTGLFIAGFFIFTGLVIHGAATLPFTTGASPVVIVFSPVRLGLLVAGFSLSVLVGIALFNILDWLTPRIPFRGVNTEPIAVGLYVFGYLVFFGLVLHAALTTPLG
ncbi:MAG: DUF350 domain-containing protein [Dehalococcoidia bacterium]|nr:DUF350 domain-containing protein [Dehalococcoidia bacterium]